MRTFYSTVFLCLTALLCPIITAAQQPDLIPLTEKGSRFGQTRVEQRRFPEIDRELAKMEENKSLLKDDSLQTYLQGVLDILIPAKLDEIPVRIMVLKSPEVNAGMYMNGVLLIHTGLLAELDNEAQLAFVICHEMAHLIYRHPLLEHYKNEGEGGVHRYPSLSISRRKETYYTYPSKLESDADSLAWELFFDSPYSLPEAVAAIDKMPAIDSLHYNFFLRELGFMPDIPAHPKSEARQTFLRKRLAEAPPREGLLGQENYCVRTRNLAMFNIRLLHLSGANYKTLARLDTLLHVLPDSSSRYYKEVQLTKGEVYAEMLFNPRRTGMMINVHEQNLGSKKIPLIESEEAMRIFNQAKPELEKEALAILMPFLEDPHLDYRVHRALGLMANGAKNYEEAKKQFEAYLNSGKIIYDQEFIDSLLKKMPGIK